MWKVLGLIRALLSLLHPLAIVALTIFIIFKNDMTNHKIIPIVITLHATDVLHLLINNYIN